MTAILGVFCDSDGGRTPSETIAHRMLEAMRARGGDREAVWARDGALLAVSRHHWECDDDLAGATLVAEADGVVVVTDAALYYRDELRRAMARRGVTPLGDAPAHLVLAAYRAWGDDCADRLEGDVAFVIWNRTTRRVVAARDFSGKRTLCWAQFGGRLVIASTVNGVLAHPECPAELNLTAIASTAAGMFAAGHETAYQAIHVVPAGWTLGRRDAGRAELFRHWSPPPVNEGRAMPFEEGAAELRSLLQRAAAERIPSRGETVVWLSGGWDSTAVFGAGQQALQDHGDARRLRPVSMSYPPDDPGHEDELIEMAAKRWEVDVHWLRIADVPFFDKPAERAARRDEPFAHAFEMWHRALARGARAVGGGGGARVALDGMGGDQLFQVSEVYLADLLRRGRWFQLAREWRAKGLGGSGVRSFLHTAVGPLLSERARRVATALRHGRRPAGYLERRPPAWISRSFVEQTGLEERERAFAPQRGRVSCAAFETEWYLSHAYFPRVFGMVAGFALEEGIELRSPLYDRRVIEFALSRPPWERSSGRDTKLLLRRAVHGLVPDGVLAPRASRTGLTSGYFDASMRRHLPALSDRLMRDAALADAGIISAEVFRRWCDHYVRHGGAQLGVTLFFTVQAELWLRSRLRPVDALVDELSSQRVAAVRR